MIVIDNDSLQLNCGKIEGKQSVFSMNIHIAFNFFILTQNTYTLPPTNLSFFANVSNSSVRHLHKTKKITHNGIKVKGHEHHHAKS